MMTPMSDFTEQASVTNWPARLALVAIMLAVIALVLWAMLRGWRSRKSRQSDIPPPLGVDMAPPMSQGDPSASGLYVGTAIAGDWLDRVAVHGLGVRSRGVITLTPAGIAVERQGAPSFFVPAADVVGIRTDRGVAGTVRAKDSVIVITWRLGEVVVDTGFRADEGSGHRTLLDGLMEAFPVNADSPGSPASETPS